MSNRNKQISSKLELPIITLDAEQQAKFDIELAWCIRQINSLIQTEKDNRKVNDAAKHLNTLRSPTVSLIKKRQLMNSLFGDYRTKIKREESNNNESNKRDYVKITDQIKLEKQIKNAKFIRNSSRKNETADLDGIQRFSLTESNAETITLKKFVMKPGNEQFKFHFDLNSEK